MSSLLIATSPGLTCPPILKVHSRPRFPKGRDPTAQSWVPAECDDRTNTNLQSHVLPLLWGFLPPLGRSLRQASTSHCRFCPGPRQRGGGSHRPPLSVSGIYLPSTAPSPALSSCVDHYTDSSGAVQLLPQVRPDHGISDTSFFTLFAQNFTLGPGPAQQVAEHKYSPGQRTSISDPRPPVPHVAGAAGSPGAPLAAHPASRLLPGDPARHPLPPGQVSTSQPRLQGLRGLGQGGPQTPWGA